MLTARFETDSRFIIAAPLYPAHVCRARLTQRLGYPLGHPHGAAINGRAGDDIPRSDWPSPGSSC